MFAVVETGGKQYKVRPGQTIEVELLPLAPGSDHTLDRVLLVSTDDQTLVGQPLVSGAQVEAEVMRQGRGEKIIVFKFKSKKRYRRKTGHRQNYTYLRINDVTLNGASLAGDAAVAKRSAKVAASAVDDADEVDADIPAVDEAEVEAGEA